MFECSGIVVSIWTLLGFNGNDTFTGVYKVNIYLFLYIYHWNLPDPHLHGRFSQYWSGYYSVSDLWFWSCSDEGGVPETQTYYEKRKIWITLDELKSLCLFFHITSSILQTDFEIYQLIAIITFTNLLFCSLIRN